MEVGAARRWEEEEDEEDEEEGSMRREEDGCVDGRVDLIINPETSTLLALKSGNRVRMRPHTHANNFPTASGIERQPRGIIQGGVVVVIFVCMCVCVLAVAVV